MYVGIDVGGTSIKYGLVDSNGNIIHKGAIATGFEKEELLQNLTIIVDEYVSGSSGGVKGIGISMPGIVKENGFLLTAGAIQSFFGLNLKQEIEERTGIFTKIENDANAVAIAEKWLGNASDKRNYVCVILGTGVGGGIVINDQVYRGHNGMAGEFGWMIIDGIKDITDIETKSITQRAAIVCGLINQYNIQARKRKEKEVTDAREIFQKEEDGEQLAIEVVDQFLDDLAIGIMNLIGCFDPEIILIGGAISSNEIFIKRIQKRLIMLEKKHQSMSFLIGKGLPSVVATKLKNDAGILGAVYQVKIAQEQLNKEMSK